MSAAANGISEARYPTVFKDPSVVNTTLHEALTKAGITHTYELGEGRHEWAVWRRHLRDVAPLFFK
jgi:enterochelin esterase-like enzyme